MRHAHREPCGDVLRHQQVIAPARVHRTGARCRRLAMAPEAIAAPRALDRAVGGRGLAVASRIAEAGGAAFLQVTPPRALDFKKERVDWIVDPEELEALAGQRAVFDLGPAEASRVRRTAVEWGLDRAAAPPR